MRKKPLPPEEKRNSALARHFERIAGGRSIQVLRLEMKEAGYDIGQGTLNRLAHGETGVRMDSIKKLAAFARMEPDELLREDGRSEEDEFVQVRRADVKFSNGHGQIVYHVDDKPPLSFRADFLRKLNIPSGRAVVVEAVGNSNEDKIQDGAIVLVNTSDNNNLNGRFFAFRVDGELLIKRLNRMPGVGVVATAENSNFTPKVKIYPEADEIEFEVLGHAVWTGALL